MAMAVFHPYTVMLSHGWWPLRGHPKSMKVKLLQLQVNKSSWFRSGEFGDQMYGVCWGYITRSPRWSENQLRASCAVNILKMKQVSMFSAVTMPRLPPTELYKISPCKNEKLYKWKNVAVTSFYRKYRNIISIHWRGGGKLHWVL